jgi:hypothetical protein
MLTISIRLLILIEKSSTNPNFASRGGGGLKANEIRVRMHDGDMSKDTKIGISRQAERTKQAAGKMPT